MLIAASDADPQAAGVHAESERNRLGGAAAFVAHLAAISDLRPGLSRERAVAAAALVLMEPAVYRTLVREHGWTRAEYARWIERVAGTELLGGPAPKAERGRAGEAESSSLGGASAVRDGCDRAVSRFLGGLRVRPVRMIG